jgi:hypothetical protein
MPVRLLAGAVATIVVWVVGAEVARADLNLVFARPISPA